MPLGEGTETIVWDICSYQVPATVGPKASTYKNHKFYNLTVQAIARGGGDCATKDGSMCDRFVDMRASVKIQVENGLSKTFYLQGQTMDVSDQAIFHLKVFRSS